MKLLDLHTHKGRNDNDNIAIVDCLTSPTLLADNQHFSCGIHPWHITDDWQSTFQQVDALASSSLCLAIGECGLDKLAELPIAQQMDVFKAHVTMSESHSKPLIIHCVKAFDELISLRRSLRPSQPWIVHGFRGKPQQAHQLLGHGFYLSFGEHFNVDSLRTCPLDRMFLETDESDRSIRDIYSLASRSLSISIEQLLSSQPLSLFPSF